MFLWEEIFIESFEARGKATSTMEFEKFSVERQTGQVKSIESDLTFFKTQVKRLMN